MKGGFDGLAAIISRVEDLKKINNIFEKVQSRASTFLKREAPSASGDFQLPCKEHNVTKTSKVTTNPLFSLLESMR